MNPEKTRIAFGDQLRRIRTSKGVSQEHLAAQSGLDRSYVGSVERGERNISLENIFQLAEALGVPSSKLLESDE